MNAELPASILASPPAGQRAVELGVRAENAEIVEPDAAHCQLRVDYAEPTGSDIYLNGSIGGQLVVARIDRDMRVAPGDLVPIRWRLDAASAFDAESGARL